MSNARNHHYVPQCYLKGFAKLRSKSSNLTAYDLGRGKVFCPTPRNIAAKRDYNRVEIEGVDPNFIESEWSKAETEFDQALGRVIQRRSIDDLTDLHWILALLSRIIVSNPDFRQVRGNFIEDIASKILNIALSSEQQWDSVIGKAVTGTPIPYEKMKSAVAEGRIVPKASKEKLVQDEAELWPKILDILVQRNWTLIIARQGQGHFATSDRPFSLRFNDAKPRHSVHRLGLGMKNTTLTFPVNKSMVLIGRFENAADEAIAEREQIAAINNNILTTASDQVYCPTHFSVIDIDFEIRDFEHSKIWQVFCQQSA